MILMSFKDVRIEISCVIYFFFSPSTNVTGAAVRPVNPQPHRMRLVVYAEAFQMRQMALTTLSSLTGILPCGWSSRCFSQRT